MRPGALYHEDLGIISPIAFCITTGLLLVTAVVGDLVERAKGTMTLNAHARYIDSALRIKLSRSTN